MFRNFLNETILTGKVNHLHFHDFPNSLLLEKNKNYELFLENENCIIEINVNYIDSSTPFILPLADGSINYIIDWGDENQLLVSDLYYLGDTFQSIDELLSIPTLKIGNFAFINKILFVYNGLTFIENKDIKKEEICFNPYLYLYAIYKEKNEINYNLSKIYKKDCFIPSHLYSVENNYFIKINGGFTGFNTLKYSENPFYLIKKPTLTINDIKFFTALNLDTNNQTVYNYYSPSSIFINADINEKLSIEETKELLKTNEYLKFSLNEGIIHGYISSYFSDNSSSYISAYNSNTLLNPYKTLLELIQEKNISGTYLNTNKEKVNIDFSMVINDTLYYELVNVLSWGTNTNWQDMNASFYNAKSLESIPESDLPNVNGCISTFMNCISLKKIPSCIFFPHALISSSYMFANCSGLTNDFSLHKMAPYNTVVTNMFEGTNLLSTQYPYDYFKKEYFEEN